MLKWSAAPALQQRAAKAVAAFTRAEVVAREQVRGGVLQPLQQMLHSDFQQLYEAAKEALKLLPDAPFACPANAGAAGQLRGHLRRRRRCYTEKLDIRETTKVVRSQSRVLLRTGVLQGVMTAGIVHLALKRPDEEHFHRR
jgi:hypothetical protein